MRATRRAAVTASGAAALGLSGCTTNGSDTSSTSASPSASTATDATSPDPDRVAIDRAAALTAAMLAETQESGARADPGGLLASLHRTHLAALQEATGPTASPGSVPPVVGPLPTRARLRRLEIKAQRELAMLAQHAESGPLARLLASMSAGIAAHLAAPEQATG